MQLTANIEGLNDLEKQLRALGGDGSIASAKVLRSAMMSASLPMLRDMQRNAPVSPPSEPRKYTTKRGPKGSLKYRIAKSRKHGEVEIKPGFLKYKVRRRSYINKTGSGNRNIRGSGLVKVRLGAFVPYACMVELGTEDTPAQPFIRPAFDGGWRGLLSNFGGLIEKRLASAIRRQNR